MKKRLRSPSLFWTFAGSFLAVLIAAAILQVLVMVLVLRPMARHWAGTRAALLTSQVAAQIAELPAPPSDDDILAVLRAHRKEAGSELLIFQGADGRIISDRRFPFPMSTRFGQIGDGEASPPGEGPEEERLRPPGPGRPWREGGPERGGGPPEVLSRRPVETEAGRIGQVLVLARPQRFPMWPLGVPRPILLPLSIAVFVAGAAGLIMFRVLLRRLRALEDLAARVTEGDLDARVPDPGPDEIGRLGSRLNRMTESLAEAMRSIEKSDRGRRRLLADISHELATPLTSIRGYAETLLDPSVPVSEEERSGYLQSVLEESKRMDLLIEDLLELTRLEAGAVSLSRVRLDWAELSRNVITRFEARFRQAGLKLEWSGQAQESWVYADGRRLEQVLENLLVNALRYVPAGGTVRLSIERTKRTRPAGGTELVRYSEREERGGESGQEGRDSRDGTQESEADVYRLTVEDDGPGFPTEDLPRVFDRFYRADAARSSGGSGLGLAIVKEIILLHGGDVRVENKAPSGAAIHVALPASS